jgi:hypothetical protein
MNMHVIYTENRYTFYFYILYSAMSILNYILMLTKIYVCNKFLYDHGYIYRKPVYFLFLDSVVVCPH